MSLMWHNESRNEVLGTRCRVDILCSRAPSPLLGTHKSLTHLTPHPARSDLITAEDVFDEAPGAVQFEGYKPTPAQRLERQVQQVLVSVCKEGVAE